MQKIFSKEVIDCRAGVLIIGTGETPSWPAFLVTLGVWLYNTDIDEFG
jgi:hypothetical protein